MELITAWIFNYFPILAARAESLLFDSVPVDKIGKILKRKV